MRGGNDKKELEIIIRPEKLEDVKKVLDEANCGGMTVATIMGCGAQKGIVDGDVVRVIKGYKTTINLLPKIKIEAVVPDESVEDIILKIQEKCSSDHVGDGKIFIHNIEEAIRIRTGERGDKAL
ncbi:MAG: P-II family nitrogen regulator [Clostridiales bacterium]|nr:P-II family nitrogen regulator [Clostridiales bacterium]